MVEELVYRTRMIGRFVIIKVSVEYSSAFVMFSAQLMDIVILMVPSPLACSLRPL